MKIGHFVSGASVILAAWLAVTFVYHVPAQRYLKPEKDMTAEGARKPPADRTAGTVTQSAAARVLVSR